MSRTLLRKRAFDFSSLTAGQSATEVPIACCDISCFGDVVMVVRLHSNAITGTSAIVVAAYDAAPSEDDPAQTFVSPSAAAQVSIDASSAAGALLVAGLDAGFGDALQIHVTGTRQGSDTVRAEISIELVGRPGVAAPRRSLADTLVVGNTTQGTDVVVTSGDEVRGDDGSAAGALSLRGGDGTAASNGGAVAVRGGSSAAGAGGGISLTTGTGATDDGDLDLLTPSSGGAVRLRTQSTFVGTTLDALTYAATLTVALGGGTQDIALASLATDGHNLKLDVAVTAHEVGVAASLKSGLIAQTFYRATGTVLSLTAHVTNQQGVGGVGTDLSFALVASGSTINLRIVNAGASNRTVYVTVRWLRQEGGFAS
ncbi:MAG: hypothetical protein K1X88_01700 [Nannocystaceae bacterium]|nr:hypothetical protein [Nannocystaceae bacterium]